MKKFWKRTEGFTLVELVVVIAILGILAGVGTVGYSGYVKKANMAADRQLVGYINQAYAIACVQNGMNAADTTANHIRIGNDNKMEALEVTSTLADKIESAFAVNYPEYATAEFKVAKQLNFSAGVFVADFDGAPMKAVTVDGKTYYVNQSSIDNFLAATVFSENMTQMQAQVDLLANAFGGFINDESAGRFGADFAEYIKDATTPAEKGNLAVKYVAQKTAGMTAQDAMANLCNAAFYMKVNGGNNPSLMDVLEAADSTGDPLSTAAMMYGAVTAYANGTDNDELKSQAANVNDGASLLLLFQSAAKNQNFLDYCGNYTYDANGVTSTTPSDEFVRDMNGYLGALDAMNSVSDAIDTSKENVWSGENVNDLLKQILGSDAEA